MEERDTCVMPKKLVTLSGCNFERCLYLLDGKQSLLQSKAKGLHVVKCKNRGEKTKRISTFIIL